MRVCKFIFIGKIMAAFVLGFMFSDMHHEIKKLKKQTKKLEVAVKRLQEYDDDLK